MIKAKLSFFVFLLTIVGLTSSYKSCKREPTQSVESEHQQKENQQKEDQPQESQQQKQETLAAAIKSLKAGIVQAYVTFINDQEKPLKTIIKFRAKLQSTTIHVYLKDRVKQQLTTRLERARKKDRSKTELTEVDFLAMEKEIQEEKAAINAMNFGADGKLFQINLLKLALTVGRLNLQIKNKEKELAALKNKN